MTTSDQYIAHVEKYIGTHGRPNVFTREYASRHGAAFLNAPWCAMGTTKNLRDTGLLGVFGGQDYAYVPYIERLDTWHRGTSGLRRGDIPTFDWQGDGLADHVGAVVTKVSGDRVWTIEHNTSGAKGGRTARRVRNRSSIRGYLRPPYSSSPSTGSTSSTTGSDQLDRATVKLLQARLGVARDGRAGRDTWRALQRRLGTPADGTVSGQRSTAAQVGDGIVPATWQYVGPKGTGSTMVKALQKRLGVTADGLMGPKSRRALRKALTSDDGFLKG